MTKLEHRDMIFASEGWEEISVSFCFENWIPGSRAKGYPLGPEDDNCELFLRIWLGIRGLMGGKLFG